MFIRLIAHLYSEGFFTLIFQAKIEVEQYLSYRHATCRDQETLSEVASRVFYHLYQHISSNKIPMTASVGPRYPSSTLESRGTSSEAGVAQVFFCAALHIFTSQKLPKILREKIFPQ